jgi:hypothetical protein
MELVSAAGTLASVVVTLSLLEEFAGGQKPGVRFLERCRFTCCDVCVALCNGSSREFALGGGVGCDTEEKENDGD